MTLAEVKRIIKTECDKIRGQTHVKAAIYNCIVAAFMAGGFHEPILLVAPPGVGKSRILELWNALFRACLGRRVLKFSRGEETGTKNSFIEDVLVPHFHDKPAVLSIDEAHEMNAKNKAIIRSLLEPRADRRPNTVRFHSDYECTFDPNKQTIILATNQIDKLDDALISRCRRIDLSLYSDEEMMGILTDGLTAQAGMPNITFADNTLKTIAACNRGTARDLIHWINAIRNRCTLTGKNSINKADAKLIIESRECYPLGVTANELKTLLYLESKGELQLKELAALNIINVKEQNANEKYLLQRRLIGIDSKRRLTTEGREYLADLRKHKYSIDGLIAKK